MRSTRMMVTAAATLCLAAGAMAAEVPADDAAAEAYLTPQLPGSGELDLPAAELDDTTTDESADERAAAGERGGDLGDVHGVEAAGREAVLLQRIAVALAEPPEDTDRMEVRRRLSELIRDSSELALVADADDLKLDAYSLHMQALHAYVTIFPYDVRVETYLGRMRQTAERAKTLPGEQARPIGDFWLLAADLVELERTDLSLDQQRERTKPLLRAYLRKHRDHPAAYAVRQMQRDLEAPPESAASQQTNADADEANDDTPTDTPRGPEVRPAFRVPFNFDDAQDEPADADDAARP